LNLVIPSWFASNGYFGVRMVEMATRYGAEVRRIDRPGGDVFALEEIEGALKKKTAKVVALVHAETSTGALQPLDGIPEIAHRYRGLLVLECVTLLGGVPVKIDEWDVDVAYSGTKKPYPARRDWLLWRRGNALFKPGTCARSNLRIGIWI
jgi:alanine-glyoxylate transaminase/serine-glyoxylate transaminase/serine-pyruvate transaminase